MHVLHVLPTRADAYGGPIRVAEALCVQLERRGHHAEIFPPVDPARSASNTIAYWPGIRALQLLQARISAVDLVHVHGLWTVPTSAAALYARASRRPFVITPHGMLDRWSLQHHAGRKKLYALVLERGNLDAASAIHFFNEEERSEAEAFGIRAPSFLLPNGIDVEQFADLPGREAMWRRHPRTTGKKVVLFLGRLHPKKGLVLLVEAFARLGASRDDACLVIAGPDEAGHRAQIEALVARKQLANHVLFTGPVAGQDKRLLLGAADVFVLPSYQEGDSIAVKEALAAGVPVLITHPCHFPQVAEADAGLVVKPDVNEISIALEALCVDDALRSRMAGNTRPLVRRYYAWDMLGAELVQRYEEVLARRRLQDLAATRGAR